ncbi:hypothetical protein [Mycolicibacterium aichiense]|uniref:DUF8021 domain-containing protein n=1 Tax=Mycolicibacterium aichiense TaxID=1799 RepID=A0AAD1HI20_9MYCO|nr:hypothetical protein [Mycolicibacterium aichiense]MCV7021180.1 hypothetical protein [Mycolicibacterium aichiense]BBX05758.1 hypothetical protein MAIC_05610 [Mycolicibacterium aichiense]STZ24899.1 site-specific recombinase XerC [Mycolicibacterium aichiense]
MAGGQERSDPGKGPVSDEERIAAARAYIEALASHKADDVPFAPGCTRIEFGVKTGFSGDQLRRSLNRGPQYLVIKSVSEPEFSVNGDEVHARFELLTKPVLAGRRVAARIDETFLIPAADGKIHHIRAIVRPFITS